jgi:glutaconate CoA-transferase subunit B
VEACDFVTNVGHRTADGRTRSEVGYRGGGPDWLVTDLGLFDFDANGELRLRGLYPDTTVDDVLANTGFAPGIADPLATIAMPDGEIVEIVRGLDPLRVHERELRAEDRERRFPLGEAEVIHA